MLIFFNLSCLLNKLIIIKVLLLFLVSFRTDPKNLFYDQNHLAENFFNDDMLVHIVCVIQSFLDVDPFCLQRDFTGSLHFQVLKSLSITQIYFQLNQLYV